MAKPGMITLNQKKDDALIDFGIKKRDCAYSISISDEQYFLVQLKRLPNSCFLNIFCGLLACKSNGGI